jgi:hypothetical protein
MILVEYLAVAGVHLDLVILAIVTRDLDVVDDVAVIASFQFCLVDCTGYGLERCLAQRERPSTNLPAKRRGVMLVLPVSNISTGPI